MDRRGLGTCWHGNKLEGIRMDQTTTTTLMQPKLKSFASNNARPGVYFNTPHTAIACDRKTTAFLLITVDKFETASTDEQPGHPPTDLEIVSN